MVSLSGTVARERAIYPRPISAMPDIVMLRIPSEFRRPELVAGRHHPILVETIEEQHELELFLDQERAAPCAPDLLDTRPSTLQVEQVAIAHYAPPAAGWPYVLLCRWPADLAAAAPEELRIFARGAYTIELFEDREQLERASERVLALLGRRRRTYVEVIPPDWSAAPDGTRH